MARSLFIEITGSAAGFKRELESAIASTDKANSGFSKMGKAAGVAGLAIAGGLAYGLEKSVKAATDAQASTARLDAGFKAAGLSSLKYAGQISGAESAGRKLGFTNTDVRDSLGSLVVAAKNTGKAVTDLGVAEDIARFKHVSLADASKMLTMAMTGSQRAAKQLGIIVPTVSTALDALKAAHSSLITTLHKHSAATVKLVEDHAFFQTALGKSEEAQAKLQDKMSTGNAIIAEVSKRVHGQGQAFADTAQGGAAQLHAQLVGLEEVLGKALLPALTTVATALASFAAYLTANPMLAKVMIAGLGALAVALLATSVAAMGTAAALTLGIGAAVIAVAAGVTLMITHWHEVKAAMNEVMEWVRSHWVLIGTLIAGPIGFAVAEVATHWVTIKNDAVSAWDGIKSFFQKTVHDIASFFTSLPGDIVNAITGAFGILEKGIKDLFSWKTIVGWIKDALGFGSPSPHFMAIGHDMIESIIHGAGAAAGLLKSAVERIALDVMNSFPGSSTAHPSPRGGGPGLGGSGGLVPQVTEALGFARAHGWHGVVTSGFRTYAEQAALYDRYLHGGPLAAPPGHSSHELGQAVDVTDYQQFGQIMAIAPGFERLYNRLGARDPVHYSVTGYAQGGIVTQPTLALIGERGPEAVIPLSRGGGLGGNLTIQFTGPVYADERGIRELTDKVSRELYRKQKRNTTLGFR